MCESAVYIIKNGQEQLVLELVENLEVNEDQIHLRNIFGEKKELKAKVRSFSMNDHKIILQPI
ncbi:MAG: CooT family nickel-binding protein [Desulfobacteraceae bacterium]|nr:MAG: CooT family nickel-binding protein [Desulfobacteraceae bacterium]